MKFRALFLFIAALVIFATLSSRSTMPQGFAPAPRPVASPTPVPPEPLFPQPGCIPGTDPGCKPH